MLNGISTQVMQSTANLGTRNPHCTKCLPPVLEAEIYLGLQLTGMQVGCCKELRLFMFPTAACRTKSVCRKQSTLILPETFKRDFPKAPINRAAC